MSEAIATISEDKDHLQVTTLTTDTTTFNLNTMFQTKIKHTRKLAKKTNTKTKHPAPKNFHALHQLKI